MLEIVDELGVTESRISQMRSEALTPMGAWMTASLDPDQLPAGRRPDGRLAKEGRPPRDRCCQIDLRARLVATLPLQQRVSAWHPQGIGAGGEDELRTTATSLSKLRMSY